jgi:hypothetical protein
MDLRIDSTNEQFEGWIDLPEQRTKPPADATATIHRGIRVASERS